MDIPNDQVQIDQPKADEIDPNQVQTDINPDEVQIDQPQSQYGTMGQQALTAVEGVGQGLAGPLATGLELGAHKLGIDTDLGIDTSAEAQAGRRSANPVTHSVAEAGALAGSLMTGIGEAGLIARGAKSLLPEATTTLGKIGSAALKGFMESAAIQGGDEMSKAMIGQGDPEHPVSSVLAHVGGAGLLGMVTGGVFNGLGQGVNKGLASVENAKMGDRASKLLAGMGIAAKAHEAGIPEKDVEQFAKYFPEFAGEDFNYNHYKPGVKAYYSGIQSAVNKVADTTVNAAAATGGNAVAGPVGGLAAYNLSNKYLAPAIEKILQKPLIGVTKLALPTIMYALSKGETSGLFNALNYATQAAKGAQAINKGIESIFKGAGQQSLDYLASERDRKRIEDYIDDGGVQKEMQDSLQTQPNQPEQAFAKGGSVAPQTNASLGNLYPNQSMLMSSAKGRMSNYLNSIKPQSNPQKLPFDKAPDQKVQQRAYSNAVGLAAQPLSIMKSIKNGTLQLDDLKHLSSMYPELYQHLQKKMTERMMNAQLDDEVPKHKTKQALALFLGAPLESHMTPQGIMAAQATFAPQQTPQQVQQAKGKKGTSNLGKSNKSYQTASESAESDRTNRKD